MSLAAYGYRLPLAIPYRWAKGVQHERAGVLVRIDRDGAIGWGEVAPPPHETVDEADLIAQVHAAAEGLDPAGEDFLTALDGREMYARVRCALATAWLSARAAGDGQSLAQYLAAGEAPARRVGVNSLVTDAEPDDAAATARALVDEGYRTLKIKCTSERAENLARVAAIRAAAPSAALRLDPNEGLAAAWAADHLNELAQFDIEYAEQPIAQHDPSSLRALREASRVPIAADEAAKDFDAVSALIDAEAVDTLILKPQRLGGPDKLLAIARMAAERGIASTVTNSLESAVGLATALHIAACLPQPAPDCGLGTARYFARDVADPPPVEAGRMTVPEAPGLGVVPEVEG
jgi:o-succinylbenzoate synthase